MEEEEKEAVPEDTEGEVETGTRVQEDNAEEEVSQGRVKACWLLRLGTGTRLARLRVWCDLVTVLSTEC